VFEIHQKSGLEVKGYSQWKNVVHEIFNYLFCVIKTESNLGEESVELERRTRD